MSTKTRHAVKVILLNDSNELLLMCMDDPTIRSVGEEYRGRFWNLIGGAIEPGESLREAAEREIFEETGLPMEYVDLGPHVWFGELDLVIHNKETHIKQDFLVAKTERTKVSLEHLTRYEKTVVRQVSWFSFDDIVRSVETIHPVVLRKYLPDIIEGNYPDPPIEIDLSADAVLE